MISQVKYIYYFFSCRMAFPSGTVIYLVKLKTHSKIILTDNCLKFFDAVKDVYKGLNGFPTYFSLQYEDNEFGFVDLDSPIQLADQKSNMLLVKTDSPENEVNDTILTASKVTDKKRSVSFGTLVSVDSENSEDSQSTSSSL